MASGEVTVSCCDGLILVDLQRGMFDGSRIPPVASAAKVQSSVRHLIEKAREAKVPIIYVRHGGTVGHPLAEGTEGAEGQLGLESRPDDPIIVKRTPDSFHETPLLQVLRDRSVGYPAIAGLQTEYCIDTTCRRAFSLGLKVTLATDGHSTWDTDILAADQIIAHHNETLGNLFVALGTVAEIQFCTSVVDP